MNEEQRDDNGGRQVKVETVWVGENVRCVVTGVNTQGIVKKGGSWQQM